MSKLLMTLILTIPLIAFAESVPIKDQTTLPCDDSSSIDCGKSITTNTPDPSAGQDDANTNKACQFKSVTPLNDHSPTNNTVSPIAQPKGLPPN